MFVKQDTTSTRAIASALRDADAAIARLIREDGIDLLVDRHGYTLGGRLGILASRPAPVQVHYMSFPGTLGYDDVIDPRELRNALLRGLALAEGRTSGPFRPVRSRGVRP